jgi:hypothetical protein
MHVSEFILCGMSTHGETAFYGGFKAQYEKVPGCLPRLPRVPWGATCQHGVDQSLRATHLSRGGDSDGLLGLVTSTHGEVLHSHDDIHTLDDISEDDLI